MEGLVFNTLQKGPKSLVKKPRRSRGFRTLPVFVHKHKHNNNNSYFGEFGYMTPGEGMKKLRQLTEAAFFVRFYFPTVKATKKSHKDGTKSPANSPKQPFHMLLFAFWLVSKKTGQNLEVINEL